MKRRNTEDIVLSSDDEPTKDQLDEKRLKTKEEPVDSQEVIELKQKVAKLEKDFQGSCRYAREFELRMEEAQKRVEFLEGLIEKKPLVADATDKKLAEELQKKIDELTSKLAQADNVQEKLVEEQQKKIDELTSKLAEADNVQEKLVEEQRKVCSLTKELENERSRAKEERRRLNDKIDDLRDHRDELEDQLDDSEKKLKEEQQNKGDVSLTKQLELEKSLAKEDRTRYRAKIDELRDYRIKLERKLDEADERERLAKKEKEKSMLINAVKNADEGTKKRPEKAAARIAPSQDCILEKVVRVEKNLYKRYIMEILGAKSDYEEKASENEIAQLVGVVQKLKKDEHTIIDNSLNKQVNFSEVKCLLRGCGAKLESAHNFLAHIASNNHVMLMKCIGVSKKSVAFLIHEFTKKKN